MDTSQFTRHSDFEWFIKPFGQMRVPAIIYATEDLIRDMDQKVFEQVTNVATLPGIVKASYAMPDAHWGYGFPIGGVAAFDANEGGIVSAGGVGYDVSCVSEDSRVLYLHGYTRRIAEVAEQDCIAIQDFETGQTASATLFNLFRRSPSTPVYRVKTESGREIIATADHPFYTPVGMVSLEQISVGEQTALFGFEGVGYEEPSAEVILSEEQINGFLSSYGKGAGGSALAQLLKHLRERDLLPLRYNSPATPYLLKLLGFVLGDGTITLFKAGRAAVSFYGQCEDLEAIRQDIARLGFNASRIYSRPRNHSIRTFYNQVEFSAVEHTAKCNATSLALLLAALGCPIGNKATQSYRLPEWIRRAPLWQKRLFLSAFFGAEMITPKPVSKKNFYQPMISMSKELSLIGNAREFLEDISDLLTEFGVKTMTISRVEDDYERKGGGRSGRYRLILSSRPEDLIALYEKVGFSYNPHRMVKGLLTAYYLRRKARVLERRIAVAAEAQIMHRESALSARTIHRALGSPADIPLRFIERSIYERRKTPPRVWSGFQTFEDFCLEATAGLGESGMVWDTIVSKETIDPPEWVYDFTVNHQSHNFVANCFVVSNCGVRTLLTGLTLEDVQSAKQQLAETLVRHVPAGVGSRGKIKLSDAEMDEMLTGGASWAVGRGYGTPQDLECIEERGRMRGSNPKAVSPRARERQRAEMGTLGSGNHYLEVQHVAVIYDLETAAAFGIELNDIVLSIHCGSRGLGHQIGTEFLKEMAIAASGYGIKLPDRELACAPINSPVGQEYLGAMRAAINCALANRQIITHLTREAFAEVLPQTELKLLYDVSHNTCKVEEYDVNGQKRKLYVHRKGATRAFGPGHPALPAVFERTGQPVLIGGTMGTASYILVGTKESEELSFSSSCHGAGRAMSRHEALKQWKGRELVDHLASKGIIIRSPSMRGVAEEAPGAYKDVGEVVDAADMAKLSRKVARLEPLVCIKG